MVADEVYRSNSDLGDKESSNNRSKYKWFVLDSKGVDEFELKLHSLAERQKIAHMVARGIRRPIGDLSSVPTAGAKRAKMKSELSDAQREYDRDNNALYTLVMDIISLGSASDVAKEIRRDYLPTTDGVGLLAYLRSLDDITTEGAQDRIEQKWKDL